MTFVLPSLVTEIAATYRLNSDLVEKAVATSKHVYERNEIGGPSLVVDDFNVKAFVKEVRDLRSKKPWK